MCIAEYICTSLMEYRSRFCVAHASSSYSWFVFCNIISIFGTYIISFLIDSKNPARKKKYMVMIINSMLTSFQYPLDCFFVFFSCFSFSFLYLRPNLLSFSFLSDTCKQHAYREENIYYRWNTLRVTLFYCYSSVLFFFPGMILIYLFDCNSIPFFATDRRRCVRESLCIHLDTITTWLR